MTQQEEPVYITGHRHPDTDSVVSAIAFAFFKRSQGVHAIPCRLGPLNHETSWLLKKFGFEEPMLLKDARKTLGEIEIDSPVYVTPDMTVLETVQVMEENDRSSLAVLDEKKQLAGFVSKSDLASLGLGDTAAEIELLKHTGMKHLARAIDGEIVYDDAQYHINGKVSIITLASTKTANYEIQDRIVIVGDDPQSQLDLIEKGAGVLIAVWSSRIHEDVLKAAKEHHCPIIRSGHGSVNTMRYLFLAPPVSLIMKKPVLFHDTEFVEDVGKKMMKNRFRSYPVIDHDGNLKGYVSRYHVLDYSNKKLILVDHNEFSQSVHGVEKAQILQVIDHHRINDFATSQPVSFRNEIVGSTATIITTMFRENQIPLTREMAGILLGAILSDTLLFQSPTTTETDHKNADILAAIADLDIESFGKEMFAASAASDDQSMHDMIVSDIKYYDISGCRTMISQVITADLDSVKMRSHEIELELETLASKKHLDLIVTAFSSIGDHGSIFYSAGDQASKCQEAFPDTNGLHTLQKNILSRKQQILPMLTRVIES